MNTDIVSGMECYFCGMEINDSRVDCQQNNCVAVYCSNSCQDRHFEDHQEVCGTEKSNRKAGYYSVLDSLYPCDDKNVMDMMQSISLVVRNPKAFSLANRCGYDISDELVSEKRLMEALVSYGEDNEDNLKMFFGYTGVIKMCPGLQHECDTPIPNRWKRCHLEARIAIACNVSAPKYSYMYKCGERGPRDLPAGQPTPLNVQTGCRLLAVPSSTLANFLEPNSVCAICSGALDRSEQTEDSLLLKLPQCGHPVHWNCLESMFLHDNTCPACATPLPDKVPRPPTFQERALARRLQHHRKLARQNREESIAFVRAHNGTFRGQFQKEALPFCPISDELNASGGRFRTCFLPRQNALVGLMASAETTVNIIKRRRVCYSIRYPDGTTIRAVTTSSADSFVVLTCGFIMEYSVVDKSSSFCCSFCGNICSPEPLYCSRCVCVGYCSRECHRAHWTNGHKKVCYKASGKASEKAKFRLNWAYDNGGVGINSSEVAMIQMHPVLAQCVIFTVKCAAPLLFDASKGTLSRFVGLTSVLENLGANVWLRPDMSAFVVDNEIGYVGFRRDGEGAAHEVYKTGDFFSCSALGGDGYMYVIEDRTLIVLTPEGVASRTELTGFRHFEEVEAISVDSEKHVVYISVVLSWPTDREIYIVVPKF